MENSNTIRFKELNQPEISETGGITFTQIFWVLLVLVLVLVILGLFFVIARQNVNKVDPKACSATTTDWGVVPGAVGNTLFACGQNGTTACTVQNVPSISQAILECDRRSDICSQFSYDTNTQTFSIVGGVTGIGPGSSSVFVQQRDPLRNINM